MLKDSDIVNQFNKSRHSILRNVPLNWTLEYSFLLQFWLNLGESPILDFRKSSQLPNFSHRPNQTPRVGLGAPKLKNQR